jgi:hypothetical protein
MLNGKPSARRAGRGSGSAARTSSLIQFPTRPSPIVPTHDRQDSEQASEDVRMLIRDRRLAQIIGSPTRVGRRWTSSRALSRDPGNSMASGLIRMSANRSCTCQNTRGTMKELDRLSEGDASVTVNRSASSTRVRGLARPQQRSGWEACVRLTVVSFEGEDLREGGRPTEYQARRDSLLGFCSSFWERTALTTGARKVTDFKETRTAWVVGMAKLRQRQSGWVVVPGRGKGRMGEAITATSSASADATRIPRVRKSRSDIIPCFPRPIGDATIIGLRSSLVNPHSQTCCREQRSWSWRTARSSTWRGAQRVPGPVHVDPGEESLGPSMKIKKSCLTSTPSLDNLTKSGKARFSRRNEITFTTGPGTPSVP